MSTRSFQFACACIFYLSPLILFAEDQPENFAAREWKTLDEPKRQRVVLSETTSQEAMHRIAELFSVNVVIQNTLDGSRPVNTAIENACWADAVSAVCNQTNLCVWNRSFIADGRLLIGDSHPNLQFVRMAACNGLLIQGTLYHANDDGALNIGFQAYSPLRCFSANGATLKTLDVVLGEKRMPLLKQIPTDAEQNRLAKDLFRSGWAVDPEIAGKLNALPFDIECTFCLNWPKKILVQEHQADSAEIKWQLCEDPWRQVTITQLSEVAPFGFTLSETVRLPYASGWPFHGFIDALDADGHPLTLAYQPRGGGIGDAGSPEIRESKVVWQVSTSSRPKKLVYSFANECESKLLKVRINGLKLPPLHEATPIPEKPPKEKPAVPKDSGF